MTELTSVAMPKPSTPRARISKGMVISAAMAGSAEPLRFHSELRSSMVVTILVVMTTLVIFKADRDKRHGQRQADQQHGPEFDDGGADQQGGDPEQESRKT